MKLSTIAVVFALTLAITGEAAAQRRVERFEHAGSFVDDFESLPAVHADWRTRTTVLVVGGAVVGMAAGALSEAINCAAEQTVGGIAGDEDPDCDASYAMPMVIGAAAGGLAGFLIDLLIGHPHGSGVEP